MPVAYKAPAADFFSTTLNGSINDSQTTGITLNSVTNLNAPGVIIVDRENSAGTATPLAREFISFTSISGSVLAGTVTRGFHNSTARSHNDGGLVEATVSAGIWNSLVSQIDLAMNSDGYLRAIASPASIAAVHSHNLVTASLASINQLEVRTKLSVSGASITGTFPRQVVWRAAGHLTGPTIELHPTLPMAWGGNWEWFTFLTRTVASGVSALVDVNKNGSSIFAAVGRPYIAAGGTFASTASIATKAFNPGDKFTIDYDGQLGSITDILVTGYFTQ